MGVIDVLGICNGHCFFNVDDLIVTMSTTVSISACNYDDPANGECTTLTSAASAAEKARLVRRCRLQLRR